MMSNDDEMCAEILEVILFKIHSIQEIFLEHKIYPSVRDTTDYRSKFQGISHLAFFVELRLQRSEKGGFPLYCLVTHVPASMCCSTQRAGLLNGYSLEFAMRLASTDGDEVSGKFFITSPVTVAICFYVVLVYVILYV